MLHPSLKPSKVVVAVTKAEYENHTQVVYERDNSVDQMLVQTRTKEYELTYPSINDYFSKGNAILLPKFNLECPDVYSSQLQLNQESVQSTV